jgi:YD repeat-containing protein
LKNHASLALVASLLVPTLSLALLAADANAQTRTTTYRYDVLGRLTYVEDPVNGNRDFDYDPAGNRRMVASSTANDGSVEPGVPGPVGPPARPGSLVSQYRYDCAWLATWGAVVFASHFVFKSTREAAQQVALTPRSRTVFCDSGVPNSNKPQWVQACNSLGCSEKAYFS